MMRGSSCRRGARRAVEGGVERKSTLGESSYPMVPGKAPGGPWKRAVPVSRDGTSLSRQRVVGSGSCGSSTVFRRDADCRNGVPRVAPSPVPGGLVNGDEPWARGGCGLDVFATWDVNLVWRSWLQTHADR